MLQSDERVQEVSRPCWPLDLLSIVKETLLLLPVKKAVNFRHGYVNEGQG